MNYKPKYSEILNYKKQESSCVRVIFSCEHSSNSLDIAHIKWTNNDEKNFKNEHWGLDIGALDMAKKLAIYFETYLLYHKCSRLILDPNRDCSNRTVFVTEGDGNEVEMNKNLNEKEKEFRIKNYWLSYAMGLRKISLENNHAKYAFSIHSFTPYFNGKKRNVEIGILTSYNEDEPLVLDFLKEFKDSNFNVKVNKPYNAKLGTNFALNNLLNSHGYRSRNGLMFEIRNDLLQNKDEFEKIYNILKLVIERNIN